MAGSDSLRRYLEQVLESGESSITFQSISSTDVRRLARAAVDSDSVTTAAAERAAVVPGHGERSSAQPVEQPEAAVDWRAALRATGSEVTPKGVANRAGSVSAVNVAQQPQGKRTDIHHGAPPPSSGAVAGAPDPSVPPSGLSVTAAPSDMFVGEGQFATLDELASSVRTCTRCALHKGALNAVPGEGAANAELLCVKDCIKATSNCVAICRINLEG
jgi:hypothetical protein